MHMVSHGSMKNDSSLFWFFGLFVLFFFGRQYLLSAFTKVITSPGFLSSSQQALK